MDDALPSIQFKRQRHAPNFYFLASHMVRNLITKSTVIQHLVLAFITIAIFWDGLWAGPPHENQKRPFTFADALYPDTSYNLKWTKAYEQGARVTRIECSDGEMAPIDTTDKRSNIAINPNGLSGYWAHQVQPLLIVFIESQLWLINEHSDPSKAEITNSPRKEA